MIKLIKNLELIIIIVVALGIFVTPYAGYHPYGVLSGSMEPEVPVGSLVYANSNIEPAAIEEGEIAIYQTEEKTIVHRVIENNGQTLVTKGDANEVQDPEPIPYEQVIGSMALCIPHGGNVLNFIIENKVFVLVFVIAFNFLLFSVDKIITALKENKE